MTLGQIKEAACSPSSCAEKFMHAINDTCVQFDILTPIRQLCFLAQAGHESGGLYFTEELASGEAYEGRAEMGNTQKGDGIRFKGRGLIQITGRINYQAISTALNVDFIRDPTLLGAKNVNLCTATQIKFAALSAGWFWNSRNLNAITDKINISSPIEEGDNLQNFMALTKKINGGINGLADRLNRFKVGAKYF
ncbi:MAG: glycoside hydrolase family 19 protein [Chitinophagaceae bacterium]